MLEAVYRQIYRFCVNCERITGYTPDITRRMRRHSAFARMIYKRKQRCCPHCGCVRLNVIPRLWASSWKPGNPLPMLPNEIKLGTLLSLYWQIPEPVRDRNMTQETQTYQEVWLNLLKEWKPGNPLPPCPKCGGIMESWDAWLVTGEACKSCGFASSEGFGTI